MLFLLKRDAGTALLGLFALTALGLLIPFLCGALGRPLERPPVEWTPRAVGLGVAVFLVVVFSDVTLHVLLRGLFGKAYLRRHRELAEVFRGQSLAAVVCGAAMAGLGEELVFRGLSVSPAYLVAAAFLFGLLHHVRASLWPFTAWAVWQGLLLAAGLYCSGNLAVTMVAHFLHDLAGFLVFRRLRASPPGIP
jgi:membrane protease YdiL (CAAX protease family)